VAARGIELRVHLDDVADRERGLAADDGGVEHRRSRDIDRLPEHDERSRDEIARRDRPEQLAGEDDARRDAGAVAVAVGADRQAAHVGRHAQPQVVAGARVAVGVADRSGAVVEVHAVDDHRAEARDGAARERDLWGAGAATVDAAAATRGEERGEHEGGSA